jgi:hypothetical protein
VYIAATKDEGNPDGIERDGGFPTAFQQQRGDPMKVYTILFRERQTRHCRRHLVISI